MASRNEADRLWEMARAFQASRVLLSAVELGIFGALGDLARPSDEVAEDLGTDPRATDRLMNALVALDLLEKENGRFRNTDETARCLVPDRPGDISGALMHTNHLWDTWSTLSEAVREGTSVASRQPGDRWTVPFIAAMHANATRRAEGVVDHLDLSGVSRLLDVGGGSGAYSIAFCRARPDIEATVFDLPSVIPLTQEYVAEADLLSRIHLLAGDYTRDELGHGYDLAFLSAIIHSNDAEANRGLFARCYRALQPGGRIVVQDFIMDEDRAAPPHGALFALNMLVGTSAGDTYTEREVTGWLEGAGFREIRRQEVPGGIASLLVASRP
jgi:SAM-dependent methyltransferase